MDGATSALPGLPADSGVLSDNGLIRLLYFGEALEALSDLVSDDLLYGPSEPMIALMADAFDRMALERPDFSKTEFTLYVMSILLGLCEDPEEAKNMKIGAAKYMLAAARKLPSEYSPMMGDARKFLAASTAGTDPNIRSISPPRAAVSVPASQEDTPPPAAPRHHEPVSVRKEREQAVADSGPARPATSIRSRQTSRETGSDRSVRSGSRPTSTSQRSGLGVAVLCMLAIGLMTYVVMVSSGIVEPANSSQITGW
ncbi:hypothetical protein HKCCE3408_15090 [Rhodobacterales bacterium HKCCE3408]|nr:hypothetical protein [Rhodobacterales bacterium HKCCE3408]